MGYLMPDFFDKYQLIKRIAHGGIAEVFLAHQVGDVAGFTKQVAIKRMFPHLIERDDIISMFIDEARIVSNLNHPAIVQTFDLGVIDGSFYIAMEYVDGLDLRRVCEVGIENNAFVPAEIAVKIIIEAASGLHYAHTRVDSNGQPMGIVHRDISPQNILISRQGVVKICDFGIAKAEHRLTTTRSGEFKGKFGYMSPEQAGGLPLDWRSDIFSLGILLYEITVGTRLFRAFNEYETIKMVVNAVVEPPSNFIPNFPRDLEAIILKSLEREPSNRYQTAEELQTALEDWLYTHRQRVGTAQIARYMENLLEKIPTDSNDLPAVPRKPAAKPVSVTAKTSAQPAYSSVAAQQQQQQQQQQQILPKPDRPAPAQRSPNTGLRLPSQPSSKPVQPLPTVLPAHTDEEDLTRPLSISQSLIDEAEASYNFPSSNSLPTPASNLPKPLFQQDKPAPTSASSLPKPLFQQNKPTPTPASSLPNPLFQQENPAPTPVAPLVQPKLPAQSGQIQQMETERQPDKAWNVEPLVEEDNDTNWAQNHARKRSLMAVVFGTLFIAATVMGVWYLTQTEKPATNNLSLADNTENNALAAYRGPLLDHPTASVSLNSSPPGAHIVVNGRLTQQQTPADVSLYDDVLNEIVLYSQGFLPHSLLLAPSGATPPQSATLTPRTQPIAGKLQINSTPPGGSIILNGEAIGKTPLLLDNIASKFEHHVEISMPNHHSFAGFIHILQGIDNTIDAELAPLDQPSREVFVELAYEALPRGTQIRVDGEMRGITPFFSNHNRDSLLQIELKSLEHEGSRRVVATSGIGSFLLRPYLAPIKRESGQISLNIKPMPTNIYIGSNAYDQKQIRSIELLEGEYDAVFQTSDGTRIRTKLQVHPNKRTAYNVQLIEDRAEITTSQR